MDVGQKVVGKTIGGGPPDADSRAAVVCVGLAGVEPVVVVVPSATLVWPRARVGGVLPDAVVAGFDPHETASSAAIARLATVVDRLLIMLNLPAVPTLPGARPVPVGPNTVVGWALDSRMKARLVAAIAMAVARRGDLAATSSIRTAIVKSAARQFRADHMVRSSGE